MKMEMSYRDKVILIVLLILLVLVGGFFALIKPKYEKWQSDKKIYADTEIEWNGIDQKLTAIPTLQKNIKEKCSEYKKTAQVFVNDAFKSANETYTNEKTSYEIDQYLQPVIDECSLEVTDMTLADVTSETINYYFYEPNVVTYSLLEAADINGDYNADLAEVMKESIVLTERVVGDVMCQNVELTVNTTKENLMLFLDKMGEEKNAVLVNNVNINNYEFTDGLEVTQTGPDGQPVTVIRDGEGTSIVNITIGFYNAKPIDEPNVGA